jgi:leader peptidase (prepilin peptidase)/N-methyltransferase
VVIVVFWTLLGACVGSFLNVCIYRMPREGLSVSRPRRSFCPSCGAAISLRDNIPIVSWILLGAKCRSCRCPISGRYVLVEILTAGLFGAIAMRVDFDPAGPSIAELVVLSVLTASLIVASFIDLELRILPDAITVRGMMIAPFVLALVPSILPESQTRAVRQALSGAASWAPLASPAVAWAAAVVASGPLFLAGLYGYSRYYRAAHRGQTTRLRNGVLGGVLTAGAGGALILGVLVPPYCAQETYIAFWSSLLGMLVGASLLFLVGVIGSYGLWLVACIWAYLRHRSSVGRKVAMGFGDVKLQGMLGAFLGWSGIIGSFFLACFLGAIIGLWILIRHRTHYVPFGPFLTAAALLLLLIPEPFLQVLNWYMSLFR